jgi:3-methyladenine DNA glycosylase AlkD
LGITFNTVALSRRGLDDDVHRVVAVCTRLVGDREDLVVKALSWALRELSKKHPEQVRRFIAQHRKALAAHVIREVENRLPTGRKTFPVSNFRFATKAARC